MAVAATAGASGEGEFQRLAGQAGLTLTVCHFPAGRRRLAHFLGFAGRSPKQAPALAIPRSQRCVALDQEFPFAPARGSRLYKKFNGY